MPAASSPGTASPGARPPTSIRPPLYPGMLAAVLSVTGSKNLQAVRVLQILLALATVAGLRLGRRFQRRRRPLRGRRVLAVPVAHLLQLPDPHRNALHAPARRLRAAPVLLVQTPRRVARGRVRRLARTRRADAQHPVAAAAACFCPLLALLIRAPLPTRLALPALVLLASRSPIVARGPSATRGCRASLTIVDTMGGMNLRMGNYEHTPDDRMWDAVALTGEKSWVLRLRQRDPGGTLTEGEKEKWAQRKAIEYMRAHPGDHAARASSSSPTSGDSSASSSPACRRACIAPPFWFAMLAAAAMIVGLRRRRRCSARPESGWRARELAGARPAAAAGRRHHGRAHHRLRTLALSPAAHADPGALRRRARATTAAVARGATAGRPSLARRHVRRAARRSSGSARSWSPIWPASGRSSDDAS